MLQYNPSNGILSRTFTNPSQIPATGSWPLIANGSIAIEPMVADDTGLAAVRSIVVDPKRRSGISLAFNPCNVRFEVNGMPNQASTWSKPSTTLPLSATLDTARGVFSLSRETVTRELRVLMHSPTLLLQTLKVVGLPLTGTIRVTQTTVAPAASSFGLPPEFRGDSMDIGSGSSIFVCTASFDTLTTCSNCFLLDTMGLAAVRAAPAYVVDAEVIGEPRSMTASIEIDCSALANRTLTIHVLSSMSKSSSTTTPTQPPGISLIRKLAMSGSGISGLATSLISAHEKSWTSLWQRSIDVTFGSQPPAYAGKLRRCLRYALWNLHSCARRDGQGVIDVSGASVLRGRQDDYLVNALLLINPSGARVAIEQRRIELESGEDLACFAGLEGAAVERDGQTSLRATALLAVDTWNYFRVSADRHWLAEVGMPILRSVADYIVDQQQQQQPAIEVVASVAAVRAATEACYALSATPRDEWSDARYTLAAQLAVGPTLLLPAGVIGLSSAAEAVPEPLRTLAQPLLGLADDTGIDLALLPVNLAYWSNTSPRNAAGDLVLLQALAQKVQITGTFSDATKFEEQLITVLQRYDNETCWGNLSASEGSSGAPNDPSLSAQLFAAFSQGLGGAMIQGGYTQGGQEYASLGVNAASSACMPATWDRMTINGLGGWGDLVLLNAASDEGIVAAGGSQLSPWRYNSLLLATR